MQRIAILGGGRMGEALVAGLLDAGYDADAIAIAEARAERRQELERAAPGTRVGPSAAWAVADADVVVVAVKPNDVAGVLDGAIDALGAHACIVSIAAGVTIADLEAHAPGRPVVRAMPNTPALVGRGATAIAAGAQATEDDLATAERLLSHVGTVARVPEHLLDAVTGLSGSGPAYVFLVVEALTEAGVLNGLPRDLAVDLVAQTLVGSAELLLASDDGPEALRANVTSPGGTTAAGLAALERNGVRAAFLEAVTAATERSRELGRRS
ncbi:MAG: pyrroline-5-carboxylate reductase [Actinomycetes bacterium]